MRWGDWYPADEVDGKTTCWYDGDTRESDHMLIVQCRVEGGHARNL